jgi:hypothetical protein
VHLLGELQAGPLGLDHRDHAAQMALGPAQAGLPATDILFSNGCKRPHTSVASDAPCRLVMIDCDGHIIIHRLQATHYIGCKRRTMSLGYD